MLSTLRVASKVLCNNLKGCRYVIFFELPDGVVNVLDALDVLYCIVGLSDSNPHPSNPTRVKMLVIDGE
jgi:hypothetical protein